MDDARWADYTQQFLHRKNYTRETRESYGLALRTFKGWADERDVDPFGITVPELLDYRTFLVGKYSANTVNTRFRNLRLFFTYLFGVDAIERDIARGMVGLNEPVRTTRNILTLDELARMWTAASPGRQRVIIGLLGICGMKRNEVRRARVEDLHVREGVRVLVVPQRTGTIDVGYVAIPDQVAAEIDSFLAGRRSGLIISSKASGSIATTSIHKMVHAVAKRAVVDSSVTSLSLSYTLRSLAVRYNFSYVSVIRTIPAGSPLTARELLENVHLPPAEHASVRLGRMLESVSSDEDRIILNATLLYEDRSQHPAAAIMVASAALERVMRETVSTLGVSVSKRDPTLGTYATLLRSVGVLDLTQLRTVERMLGLRNDAAHGWFDKVTRLDAEWLLGEARRLIAHVRSEHLR